MNSNSVRTTSNTEELGSRGEARTNQKLSNNVLPAVLICAVNKHEDKDNYRTTGCESLFLIKFSDDNIAIVYVPLFLLFIFRN